MPNYKPKILFNPTGKVVEFKCGGLPYVFSPGEKKSLDGFVVHHALVETNTGLVEYEGQESTPIKSDLNEMPWKQLVSLASTEKVFQPGMKREEIIKAMEEKDGPKEGAIQEPAGQEEA